MAKTPAVPISEEYFFDQVIDLAHILHWRVAHFRPARTKYGWRTAVSANGAGFPDCVFLRERVVYAELKSEKGQLTPEEYEWLTALAEASQEVYLWKPSDFDEIQKVLEKWA